MFFSKELLLTSRYKKGEVLGEYTIPGTYTLEVKTKGTYEIEAVSGGAGGCGIASIDAWYNGAYGSTGCYYKNTFVINKGVYTITIGAGGAADGRDMYAGGDTAFENHLLLKGGQGASIPGTGAGAVGAGGYLSWSSSSNTPTYSAGYNGYYYTANYGGWSGGPQIGPQQNYGLGAYGQGGLGSTSANVGAGTGGYLKITYKGR